MNFILFHIAFISFLVATPLQPESAINKAYIVLFKDDVKIDEMHSHYEWLQNSLGPRRLTNGSSNIWHGGSRYLNDIEGLVHQYDMDGLKGYAAQLSSDLVGKIMSMSIVESVSEDQIVRTQAISRWSPWGLHRISSRKQTPGFDFIYPDTAGEGVDVYVLDSGIMVEHPEFEGRAFLGPSFVDYEANEDLTGHGTHVAGIVASKSFGVAKKARIISVKVAGMKPVGRTIDLIMGVQWIVNRVQAQNDNSLKSVINLSMVAELPNIAIERAMTAAIKAKIVVVASAGNTYGNDSCFLSPGRLADVITVGASDKLDNIAELSATGSCINIFAPGVSIVSTSNIGFSDTLHGTSMAAPHVAGVVALALAENSFREIRDVKEFLISVGTKGALHGDLKGSPNILLYESPSIFN